MVNLDDLAKKLELALDALESCHQSLDDFLALADSEKLSNYCSLHQSTSLPAKLTEASGLVFDCVVLIDQFEV